MRMTARLGIEPHLENKQTKHGPHHDDTGHGRILVGEQVRKTWVRQVTKSNREKLGRAMSVSRPSDSGLFAYMYECRRDEHTRTKVFTNEEGLCRYVQPLDLLGCHWEAGTEERCCQDQDYLALLVVFIFIQALILGNLHKAATCRGRSYSPSSESLPQTGLSLVGAAVAGGDTDAGKPPAPVAPVKLIFTNPRFSSLESVMHTH